MSDYFEGNYMKYTNSIPLPYPLSLWCLQCCWWHSAGCRTYWVCLQHRATVVTSNGVTVCAASFHLPSVSTANTNTVQHPTPPQQCETPTIPAVVISKVLLPQSNMMAAFVHSHSNIMAAVVLSHSSICSDVSPGLQTFNNYNVTQYTVLFSKVTPC
jgi:hypothetical protein